MKNIIFVLLVVLFTLIISSSAFASKSVNAIFNKEYKIKFDGESKSFYNANGEAVYPVLYDGTNYLPIRAISSLFDYPIDWDGEYKCVLIGYGSVDTNASKTDNSYKKLSNENIVAIENDEIKVFYNGLLQEFRKTVGDSSKRVYPLSYQGSTYVPIRNITELFENTIEYDPTNKEIRINTESNIRPIKDEKVAENNAGVYSNGDDFVYYNGCVYFRKYLPEDYDVMEFGEMSHTINQGSGDREIVRADSYGEMTTLFSNDSVGGFYMADERFYFRNKEGEIYTCDLQGNNRVSLGKAEWRLFEADGHRFEIIREDGIYQISTRNLIEHKKENLRFDYTLEGIVNKYVNNTPDYANNVFELKKKEGNLILYYDANGDEFDIYSYDYVSDNHKIASVSKDITVYDYTEKAHYIDYIAEKDNKLFIYVYYIAGSAGTTNGYVYCIENGKATKLVENDLGYITNAIHDDDIYVLLSSMASEEKTYIIDMNTCNVFLLEGNINVYSRSGLMQDMADEIANEEFQNALISQFKAEELLEQLKAYNTDDYKWKNPAFKLTKSYDLGIKTVYEFTISVQGFMGNGDAYRRVGVIYYLVDKYSLGRMSVLYRVSIYKGN